MIDSQSYIMMPLSSFVDAFDLGKDIVIGYYPHHFNTVKNAQYD